MMNRREFSAASIVGAFATLLPSWRGFAQRKHIDLTPFCDDQDDVGRRFNLDKPFAQDGMVYATDARIAVRTLLADTPALSSDARLPAASKLPWEVDSGDWKPWPKRRYVGRHGGPSACPYCRTKGGTEGLVLCVSCHGEGAVPVPYNDDKDWPYGDGPSYEVSCLRCKGTGWQRSRDCGYCEGKGYTDKPALIDMNGCFISGAYDTIIRPLGDVEYILIPYTIEKFYSVSETTHIVRFRGDGFDGMVMPVSV